MQQRLSTEQKSDIRQEWIKLNPGRNEVAKFNESMADKFKVSADQIVWARHKMGLKLFTKRKKRVMSTAKSLAMSERMKEVHRLAKLNVLPAIHIDMDLSMLPIIYEKGLRLDRNKSGNMAIVV